MMTPILVWTGWAPPAVAVGTDLVWNAFTKILGAAVHYREKNVNLSLVRRPGYREHSRGLTGNIRTRFWKSKQGESMSTT